MTQKNFDNIVEMFKIKFNIINNNSPDNSYKKSIEQIELLKMGVEVEIESPWNWMSDFFKIKKEITSYFRINFPEEHSNIQSMFIDFQKYVKNLMNEDYSECKRIKDEIFISY